MTLEQPNNLEGENTEKEKLLNINIVTLNYCQTVDEMIDKIKVAKQAGNVDLTMLAEYNFKIEEVLSEIKKIKEIVHRSNLDIIMAPDNQFGRNITWGEIKKEFQDYGASIEETNMSDDHRPETVGIFISREGLVYVFPKTWHLDQVHMPVHKIPNTKMGVSICGEIGHIKPEDLDNIDILYNPSREGDDPDLKWRMLYKYGNQPLTKERIAEILSKEEYFKNLLDDSHYNQGDPDYILEYDSREAREKRFNEAVERILVQSAKPGNSMYVRKIEKFLAEKAIPVIRADNARSDGVLNFLPNMKIENLEYREKFTRYNLKLGNG